jgi:5-formyltetrahydrofolate cyclo-ligase
MRARVVAARDTLAPQWRAEASGAIARRIAQMPEFARARVLMVTLPFRSEWDATLLARAALAAGRIVAAPRVDPVARMLRVLRIVDLARDVEPGYRGIPEPRAACPPIPLAEIDWILVPGLAFDTSGRRLGYGGGFYDRLLPLLPRAAPRVAGAFELQVVAAVPASPHDVAVDWIVTEQRTLQRAAG